jgi:hypothetical protein
MGVLTILFSLSRVWRIGCSTTHISFGSSLLPHCTVTSNGHWKLPISVELFTVFAIVALLYILLKQQPALCVRSALWASGSKFPAQLRVPGAPAALRKLDCSPEPTVAVGPNRRCVDGADAATYSTELTARRPTLGFCKGGALPVYVGVPTVPGTTPRCRQNSDPTTAKDSR